MISDIELVFAGGVAEIRDGFAVGGPGGIALGGVGGVGEVARIALLGGNGEDVAVGFKRGARAGGRDIGVEDQVRIDDGEAGFERGQITVESDVDGVLGTSGGVVEMNAAELLVHDAAGTGAGGL